MADELAEFLLFKGEQKQKAATEIKNLWKMFLGVDAVQLEINPLVETPQGTQIAISLISNAVYV